ncbi:hypothetical protein [Vibrio vulnificus YJ016]|uniref:Uncharacterized protein n=1 Tax=Vibrio vulnificus (strain YJ016) TaxID=196600 RepID=Q7MNT7_VIBVY|nr:hypothetical protein [Vibrio vulnificus YJ016]
MQLGNNHEKVEWIAVLGFVFTSLVLMLTSCSLLFLFEKDA